LNQITYNGGNDATEEDRLVAANVRSQTREYVYDPTWGALPEGLTDWAYVPAVAVDSQDRIYVNQRGPKSIVVYSREGELLDTWGDQFAKGAHGLHVRQESDGEYLYFTDLAQHAVVKTTLSGREIWTLGEPGRLGDWGKPFNRPTSVAFSPDGDMYVSDGYGNRRVHQFDPRLKLIRSWGEDGKGPSQFSLVHHVWFDTRGGKGRLWVCDRENNRIQIFTPEGEFIEEKTGLARPNNTWIDAQGYLYVTELGAGLTIYDPQDQVLQKIPGGEARREPGWILKPHGIWGDSQGALYIAEVEDGHRIQKFVRK
jgi:DNA-binding beta-propeller fold protein YncE